MVGGCGHYSGCSLYTQELSVSSWLNQRLGLGIAGFQALSNLAINGQYSLADLLLTHSLPLSQAWYWLCCHTAVCC